MWTAISAIAGLVVCVGLVSVALWHSSEPTRTVTEILAELESAPRR